MGEVIIGAVIFLLYLAANILSAMQEAKKTAGQKQAAGKNTPLPENGEVIIRQKPAKPKRKRESLELVLEPEDTPRAVPTLVRQLPPQGEGRRFDAAPGTFDAAAVVAPSIDPSVKPQLESITGIYEQAANTPYSSASSPVNIAEWLARPENIRQAVITAEIFGTKKW
ncbi:MAG: hypothetical protein LBH00_04210 [Planctomycetaceae bacterium]|jgi:hypothetical protein|nr:hypothetical protein [Planctomycetaceae bacterium]